MTKPEFIAAVQETIELEVSKKDLNDIFDGMIDVIKEAVIAGDSVTIPQVCKFSSKEVPAKSGVTKLRGVDTPWTKPAHKEGCVKALPAFKKLFE